MYFKSYMRIFKSSSAQKKYCYTPRCKAACCVSPPIPEKQFEELMTTGKAVRSVIVAIDAPRANRFCNNAVVPITTLKALRHHGKFNGDHNMWGVNVYTPNNYCPFLNTQHRCNVYENRPPICRSFGSPEGHECDLMMTKAEIRKFKLNAIIKRIWDKLIV